jgi:hypothetical protein
MATEGAAKPRAKKPTLPKRPSHLPHGRWLADLGDLSAAEKRLVECCARGEPWAPEGWDYERPEAGTDANKIKADLIRFLVLGGDAGHPVHEAGVVIFGAWIEDQLNLHQCTASVRLNLNKSHLIEVPNLLAAQIPELSFRGSHLPGLLADRLKLTSGLFLNDGFNATGEVRLLSATIGRELNCSGSIFSNAKGVALNADGIDVAGSIYLRDGFNASGAALFLNATIGGNLDCSGGSFSNAEGVALRADGIKIVGALLSRDASIEGAIVLTAAKIGALIDDATCWEAKGHILDGLHYDRIVGPTDASSRIEWLKSQRKDHLNKEQWKPQPWEQLIKVLREMGHPAEANEVAIEKQRVMYQETIIEGRLRRRLHWLYGGIADYGYCPTKIIGWMLGLWFFCGCLYWMAADGFAAIGPNNPVITSATLYPEAAEKCGHGNERGKQRWTECEGVPDEYSTFQPFIYSLDLILPLIDLQQESDWAPIAEGPTGKDLRPGVVTRWIMWFEILFGWFASLMFVAIVSRLVEKD